MPTPARFYALADAGAREAYADLLAASPQGSPFSGLAFADAACEGFGFEGSLLLTESAEEATGGLVVFGKRRGPLRAAALPPYGEFVTPVLREPPAMHAVHQQATPLDALAEALSEQVHQATLRLHPTLTDARPFAWAGWSLQAAMHMAAPVLGEDGQAAWRPQSRKLVRRHGADYTVEAGTAADAARLAAASMTAKDRGHPDVAACAGLAQALIDAGEARALVARGPDGSVEAAAVVPVWNREACYWMVGSRPGPAMTVLLADLVSGLVREGVDTLHLGGGNVASVAEFKRGLGGELVPVIRARWVRGRLLRLRDAWS